MFYLVKYNIKTEDEWAIHVNVISLFLQVSTATKPRLFDYYMTRRGLGLNKNSKIILQNNTPPPYFSFFFLLLWHTQAQIPELWTKVSDEYLHSLIWKLNLMWVFFSYQDLAQLDKSLCNILQEAVTPSFKCYKTKKKASPPLQRRHKQETSI